MQVFVTVCRAI